MGTIDTKTISADQLKLAISKDRVQALAFLVVKHWFKEEHFK